MSVEKEEQQQKKKKPKAQVEINPPTLADASAATAKAGSDKAKLNSLEAFEPVTTEVALADPTVMQAETEVPEIEEAEPIARMQETANITPNKIWQGSWRGWSSEQFRMRLTVETVLYGLLIVLAIFTRFWDLDLRALHHDEGVHAFYSWRYYSGGGYEQEPWKHGPFLYHITALTFWLFGPSDFTARVPAALFGVLICLLPLLLRRELGRWGALTASFLLLISPTFLYFSRFIREDIFMAFATLLLFAGLVRFVRQPSARWWYVSMAALGLLYCTKEASYFYTLLFGGFVFLWLCWQIAPRLVFIFGGYLAVAAFTFFFVAGIYSPPPIPFEQVSGPALGNYISELASHPIFWTTLILLGLGIAVGWLAFKEAAVARRDFLVSTGRAETGVSAAEALFLPYEEGSPAYAIGWLGRHWKTVGGGLLIFFVIYSVLYTGFFSSPSQGEVGLISGLWYWMAQQGVARGSQPWYYYFFIVSLYEPLALLFGTLGGGLAFFQFVRYNTRRPVRRILVQVEQTKIRAKNQPEYKYSEDEEEELDELEPAIAPRQELHAADGAEEPRFIEKTVPVRQPGNSFWPGKLRREEHPYFVSLLLTAWAFGGLAFYTWASEKMPWLTIQVALPFILLTGYFFQPVWRGIEQFLVSRQARQPVILNLKGRAAFWTLAAGIAFTIGLAYMIGLYLTSSALRVSVSQYQYDWLLIWVPPLLALVAWGVGTLLLGSRVALYTTLGVVFGLLSIFLVRTGFAYAFQQGDIPVEMGIYTQTAPDLKRTVAEINNLTMVLPERRRTPVLYDDEMRTPLDFYLREYSAARKSQDFTLKGLEASGVPNLNDYPIIMITDSRRDAMDEAQKKLLQTGYISRHRVFRWWFAEEPYRNFDQTDAAQMQFLLNRSSKISLNDAEGKLVIRQGEIMTQEKLNTAQAARGSVLGKLYSGNGGNNLILNINEAAQSVAKLGNPADASRLWRFVFYREQVQPLGHLDYTLYIRNDIAGLYRQFADLVPYPISQP